MVSFERPTYLRIPRVANLGGTSTAFSASCMLLRVRAVGERVRLGRGPLARAELTTDNPCQLETSWWKTVDHCQINNPANTGSRAHLHHHLRRQRFEEDKHSPSQSRCEAASHAGPPAKDFPSNPLRDPQTLCIAPPCTSKVNRPFSRARTRAQLPQSRFRGLFTSRETCAARSYECMRS